MIIHFNNHRNVQILDLIIPLLRIYFLINRNRGKVKLIMIHILNKNRVLLFKINEKHYISYGNADDK